MINVDASARGGTRELIAFLIGTQEFCVDIMGVREIRVWTPATPVAHSPPFMCGVINLRGVVLPIIDLALRLGLPPTVPTSRHAILVVEIGTQAVGLLVEGVSEILTVNQETVQPAPEVSSQMARDFVQGILALDGRLIACWRSTPCCRRAACSRPPDGHARGYGHSASSLSVSMVSTCWP